jgi:hypothetical protein
MRTLLSLFSLMIIVFSLSAQADQCSLITQEQALRAESLLLNSRRIQNLCELCGETSPSLITFETLIARPAGLENYWEVLLDEKNIDLAYTYVDGKNLAMLVDCPVSGVRKTIKK